MRSLSGFPLLSAIAPRLKMNKSVSRPFFKMRFLWIALFLWVVSGHALAEKIGYVDVRRLIDDSPQGLEEVKELEETFAARDRDLKGRIDVFESRRLELEKNAIVMGQEEVDRVTQELEEMQRSIRRDQRDYNEEYNESRNRSLARLQKIISDAVIHVARRDDFDLIFQQAVYVSDQVDITELVLKELVHRSEQ